MTKVADADTTALELADSSISYADIFTPLKRKNEIRLLTILPGLKEDPIRCTLNKVSLEPVPRYEALSYVWGTATAHVPVYVNGHRLHIRENLWKFLIVLRYIDKERVVFVDAISISQSDLEEKALQVMQMGQIFNKARAVRSWIGELPVGILTWKEYIDAVVILAQPPTHEKSSEKLDAFLAPFRAVDPSQASLELARSLFSPIRCVALAPYFERTWVVQEMVGAQRLILCCGDETVQWIDFLELYTNLRQVLTQLDAESLVTSEEQLSQRLEYIQKLDTRRRTFQDSFHSKPRVLPPDPKLQTVTGENTILGLVQPFLSTQCFDPRDKIYALLFLEAHDEESPGIIVDYVVGPAVLYLRVLHVSKPIKAAQQAENLRISMKVLWSDIIAVPSDDIWRERWRLFDDLEPQRYLDGDIIRAKLRYVGRVYDLQRCSGISPGIDPDNSSEVTVFRNILSSSSSFTIFHTRGAVGLDEELWQVALSPTTLICRPLGRQGARHCTGVALISSDGVYSRPASADSVFSLPDFEPFKHVAFKLDDHPSALNYQDASQMWGGILDSANDYNEEALYERRNAGDESALLSSEAWQIVCTHWYKDPDVESYFAES